jgi:hypothetical protein
MLKMPNLPEPYLYNEKQQPNILNGLNDGYVLIALIDVANLCGWLVPPLLPDRRNVRVTQSIQNVTKPTSAVGQYDFIILNASGVSI